MNKTKKDSVYIGQSKKDDLTRVLDTFGFRIAGFSNFSHVYVADKNFTYPERDIPIAVIKEEVSIDEFSLLYALELVNQDEPRLKKYHQRLKKLYHLLLS